MLSILRLGVILVLASGNLLARDSDTKTYTEVRPGWTLTKAQFAASWTGMSEAAKTNKINSFTSRLEALKADISDFKSNPKNEDGGKDFYTAVSEMITTLKSNTDNAELAAKINAMIEGAERLVNYRRTHPKRENPGTVINLATRGTDGSPYTPLAEGSGWVNAWVQDSAAEECSNPVVCSAEDYLFVALEHSSDSSIRVYRSSDMGHTWDYWGGFYYPGYTMYPGQIAYDVQTNSILIVASVSVNNNDVLFVRYNDLNNSADWSYTWVANSNDMESQPQLSVEYTYSADRICVYYHNGTSGNDIIAQSADSGNTWTTVYTSSWTGGWDGAPRGAQGSNGTAGNDVFLFVTSLPDTDYVSVVASASGVSGAWVETQLEDPLKRLTKDADIAGSHSTSVHGAMVVYNAQYPNGGKSIRGWWTPDALDSAFQHFYIDDGHFTDTLASPRVSVDGEFTAETPPATDYYHVSYYADINANGYYRVVARKAPNDWSYISESFDYWYTNDANETWLGDSVGMVTANTIWDYGTPASWYQTDNTTIATGNSTTPYIPVIVWKETLGGDDIVLSSAVNTTTSIEEDPIFNRPILNSRIVMMNNGNHLNFTLPHASYVKIRIFDAKGALVKDLSGTYRENASVSLNTQNSGTFFAVINYKGKSSVLKFTQMK